MPAASYPFLKGWHSSNSSYVPKVQKAGASKEFLAQFEKAAKPIDASLTKLDGAIKAKDRKKSEKEFLNFLKAKRAFKKQIEADAKKDPAYSSFKKYVDKLCQHLDYIEGEAEVDFPKTAVASTFDKEWSFAKKKFEAATGKKKPTEQTLKIFRNSTSIGKILRLADAAAAKGDGDAFKKAHKAFSTAKTDYIKIVVKHLNAVGQTADYKVELNDLKLRLDTIDGLLTEVNAKLNP